MVQKNKFLGYIHFVNFSDDLKKITFTETRTGSLFKRPFGYNKVLNDAIVVRNPFEGYPLMPITELISRTIQQNQLLVFCFI